MDDFTYGDEFLGRHPWPSPEQLDAQRHELYSELTAGGWTTGRNAVPVTAAGGRLQGPFNAMLISPQVGRAAQQVAAELRTSSTLTGRIRELAILTVAAVRRSDFEWFGHLSAARQEGLTDDEIDTIKDLDSPPATLSDVEAVAYTSVRQMAQVRDLNDQAFEQARDVLGWVLLQELVWLVGCYDMIALSLTVARVPLPPGEQPIFGTTDTPRNTP